MKRSRSDVNVDWYLCCICQTSDKDKLRSTESGLKSLADNLCEFYVLNGLKLDVARISTTTVNGIPNICETLSANSAKYHNNCAARYNKRALEALKQRAILLVNHVDSPLSLELLCVAFVVRKMI